MSGRRGTLGRLALCGSLLALGCTRAPPHPAPAARNAVLIVLDTLRADHLSSYGYARPTSPRLDAFGGANVRFEQARSQATCTYPSVNSLLTSRSAFHFLGQGQRRIGIPAAFPTLAERLRARGLRTGAVSASAIVRRTRSPRNRFGGFARGFDRFDEGCLERRADCVNRAARRFLNHTDEPFFLYLHYLDPHGPYRPPEEYRGRFGAPYDGAQWIENGDAGPIYGSLTGRGPKVETTPADVEHLIDLYDGEIAYLDTQLGELFAELDRRGLLASTVVVVAADHGEEFLEHGTVWHCLNLYEPTLRVPLFVHVPGVGPRPPQAAAVENLDVVPTILDALGFPVPEELEGRSLLPLLRGEAMPSRPAFALQSGFRSATDGRFKLLADVGAGTMALYDLGRDPGERTDVAAAERRTFHALRGELARWLARVEGPRSAAENRALADETRKVLESLGYLP